MDSISSYLDELLNEAIILRPELFKWWPELKSVLLEDQITFHLRDRVCEIAETTTVLQFKNLVELVIPMNPPGFHVLVSLLLQCHHDRADFFDDIPPHISLAKEISAGEHCNFLCNS